ncbi:hypothetical protein [Roseiconus nitratireducens]|uniref:hypothetical protein n=1 Tax=Roseiconus nitratireducens TaxID=2605748 RepID=UPI001F4693E3|nr:hypothetical protein [Roseiconus nitratireducens]
MSRVYGLLLVGWMVLGTAGCVGPMGAGCCGPAVTGSCDGQCDSCTGCGELYVDPWINQPADCVDPCDACGNYNGQSCGKCRSVFAGFKSLWGYRCGCDPGPVAMSDRCFAPDRCQGCDSGCDGCLAEPACGCEGPCQCGVPVEPGCGLEPGCGFEAAYPLEPACGIEPGCGFEPACGCEGPCSCDGGQVYSEPHVVESVPQGIELDSGLQPPILESPSGGRKAAPVPQQSRKIFTPRTNTARGFLNEYRR